MAVDSIFFAPALVRRLVSATYIGKLCGFWRGMNCASVRAGRQGTGSSIAASAFERQAHGLARRDRALDGDGRFQVQPRLFGCGEHGWRAGREVIEPGPRFV